MFDRAPRRSLLSRLTGRPAWPLLAAFAGVACSVYSNELIDNVPSDIGNGARAGAAGASAGATAGGTPSSGGMGSGAVPTQPEAGADGEGEGGAGAGGEGPVTPEGGGSGVAGSAGTAGGGQGGAAGSAGTAGASGTAGTAGTGGGPVGGVDLFDDFEDKNLVIAPGLANDRSGVWYTFDDGKAGTLEPDPLVTAVLSGAPEALGARGLHMTATGFASLGTGLGADFRDGKMVYDASRFTGLRFWAKVGAGKNTKHRVQISDVTTEAAGLKCKTATGTPSDQLCGNHWGVPLTLTTTWTQREVRFADLKQTPGWGKTAPAIDTTQVYGLQIVAGPDLDVDLWVDQFELF